VRKSFASTASPADAVGVCRPRGLQTTVLRAARRSAWTPVWANRGRCCWSRPVLGTWRNAYPMAGSAAPAGPGALPRRGTVAGPASRRGNRRNSGARPAKPWPQVERYVNLDRRVTLPMASWWVNYLVPPCPTTRR